LYDVYNGETQVDRHFANGNVLRKVTEEELMLEKAKDSTVETPEEIKKEKAAIDRVMRPYRVSVNVKTKLPALGVIEATYTKRQYGEYKGPKLLPQAETIRKGQEEMERFVEESNRYYSIMDQHLEKAIPILNTIPKFLKMKELYETLTVKQVNTLCAEMGIGGNNRIKFEKKFRG
jgi:hypothetical protein